MNGVVMSLEALSSIFFPSEEDIDANLFYPVASISSSMDCMVGYFTSGSLSELARCLTSYLTVGDKEPLRLVISPHLSDVDLQAIRDGLETDKNILPILFPNFRLDEETLRSESVKVLFYLIATNQLQLKVALKTSGNLHTKAWLFRTQQGDVAIHGSGNATKGGLSNNFEQLVLSRAWMDSSSKEIVEKLRKRFESFWSNSYEGVYTAEINQKTLKYIKSLSASAKPNLDLNELTALIQNELTPQQAFEKKQLIVPDWLKYDEGKFSHQGEAIRAWQNNVGRGIVAIATGGGKTLTSLVAASLLTNEHERLFVVVAVPTKPLLAQWSDEIELFSLKPTNCNGLPREKLKQTIKTGFRNLRRGVSKNEVIVVTHEALKSGALDEIDQYKSDVKTLLIADEVHNLGSYGFKKSAPDYYDYRLGLSATYERQYDEDGTKFLIDYFGGVVFEFGLDQAIGNCLVPYAYTPITVPLTSSEEESFAELTAEIKNLAYAIDYPADSEEAIALKIKCMARRRIVESATMKVQAFEKILSNQPALMKRALVFCTDKDPSQLKAVNSVLTDKAILFHQLTQAETSQKKFLDTVVEDFNDGRLHVLTSMRVLDEGFNVPQTERAFLLANNTVRRQWTQRLGRVLRLSPGTGKKQAVIYDFVALPSISDRGEFDEDLISLLKGEYQRVKFFTELSFNPAAKEGGLSLMTSLLKL